MKLTPEQQKLKNLAAKATKTANAARRAGMMLTTTKLKLKSSHLSNFQQEYFDGIFLEGKYYWNYIISFLKQKDVNGKWNKLRDFDEKISNITIAEFNPEYKKDKTKDKYILIPYTIKYLTSKMKQDIKYEVRYMLSSFFELRKKKIKGAKAPGYISKSNSISLSQYGNGFYLEKEVNQKYHAKNNVKSFYDNYRLDLTIPKNLNKELIKKKQNFKNIKLFGCDQLPKELDIACAKLVRKPSGLYIHITYYIEKSVRKSTGKSVGVDLGIKRSATTSDGETFITKTPLTPKLKKLQRQFSKQRNISKSQDKDHSKNSYKTLQKLLKEYEYLSNCKDDKTAKIVAKLVKQYNNIVYQKDNINSWKKSRGMNMVIQQSCIGRIKSELNKIGSISVGQYVPTSQLCPECCHKTPCPLGQNVFTCSQCGYEEDRDVKAAKVIMLVGLEQIRYDHTKKCWSKMPKDINAVKNISKIAKLGDISSSDGYCVSAELGSSSNKG